MSEQFEFTRNFTDPKDFTELFFDRNWEDPESFSTYEFDEKTVREDMQYLHDETKKYINGTLRQNIIAFNEDAIAALTGTTAAKDAAEAAKGAAETARSGAEAARDDAVNAKADLVEAKDAAVTARGAAETAKDVAVQAKTDAVQAKDAAVQAKTDAVNAKDAAVQAKTAAETAKTDAVTARGAAEKAKTDAVSAKVDAVGAKNDAVTARGDAVTARGDAVAAKTAAETAKKNAEGYAAAAKTSATAAGSYATAAQTAKVAAEAAASRAQQIADPEQIIAGKMDVVRSAVAGNVPLLTADGQLMDSGRGADELGGGIVYVEAKYADFCDDAGDPDYTKMLELARKITPAVEANKQVVLKLTLSQYDYEVAYLPLVFWRSRESEWGPGIWCTDYVFRFSGTAVVGENGLCIDAYITTDEGVGKAVGGCQVQKCITEIPDEGYMELLWEGVVGEHTIATNGRVDAVWLTSIHDDFFECKAVRVCVEFPAALESGRVATKLYASAYGPDYELEDGSTDSKLLASAYVPSGAAAGAKCQFDLFPRYGLWHEECHRDDGEVHTMSRINPFGYKDKGYEYIDSVKILTPTPSSSSSKATDLTAGTKITVYGVRW